MTEQNYGQSDQYERQGEESGWYPQQGWRAPQSGSYDGPRYRSGSMLRNGFSFLAGFAAGSIGMYLFDPDRGAERRHHLGDAAHEAWGGTSAALGSAWGHMRDHAGHHMHQAAALGGR